MKSTSALARRLFAVVLLLMPLAVGPAAPCRAADRPNIVWIVSEDNSKHYLKLFDGHGAPTPNIDRLASHGLVFEHAFSCSPVCSVARTTLATGIYAPRVATQFHRKLKTVSLPDDWRMFPWHLRQAGYYTTNNSKKDYNAAEGPGVWDESSGRATWRNRPDADQPFFHMESHGVSHESSLHFSEAQWKDDSPRTDPASVTVWPYFPDTPLFRYTTARYHDRIRAVDRIVGDTVAKLKADGLLEDTFIFYFGDHGGVLPRSKGYVYESGLHVPLVVRVPEKWRHVLGDGFRMGGRVGGFVSFVDFGPSVLHLAGVDVPQQMDGRPFLGEGVTLAEVNGREEAFGYADRFDEKYDFCRSLRKGRYKYIRNYHAFYPDSLQNNYRYRMVAYRQWRQMFHDGELNAVQRQFFQRKDAEALYDLRADPHETKNLAGDPRYASVLADLRSRLTRRVKSLPDLSFFPETVLVEQAADAPHSFAEERREQIARLADIADLALMPFENAKPKIERAIDSSDPWERYWAATVCSVFGDRAKPLADRARGLLGDKELLVRVRAAEFLGIIRAADPRPTIMQVLRQSDSHVTTLITLNTVVFLRDTHGYAFDIDKGDVAADGGQVGRRLEYLGQ